MSGPSRSELIRRHFELFAPAVAHLPLYHRLAEMAATDADVTDLLLVAQPGQARPVLLLAAVHDLVLRRPDLPLARWYASVTPPAELATGDPYPAFRQVCLDHADELRAVIASHGTQTNEVNRCVLLAPLVAAATADVPERPLALVELGCSAGLLLGLDRYRIEVGDAVVGDPASPVQLAGRVVDGTAPPLAPFPPAPPSSTASGSTWRPWGSTTSTGCGGSRPACGPTSRTAVERFRAAVDLLRPDPPRVVQGDFVELLPDVVRGLPADAHVVVFHCWALTYVARDRRPDLAAAIAALGSEGRTVSWLSAEAPAWCRASRHPTCPWASRRPSPRRCWACAAGATGASWSPSPRGGGTPTASGSPGSCEAAQLVGAAGAFAGSATV